METTFELPDSLKTRAAAKIAERRLLSGASTVGSDFWAHCKQLWATWKAEAPTTCAGTKPSPLLCHVFEYALETRSLGWSRTKAEQFLLEKNPPAATMFDVYTALVQLRQLVELYLGCTLPRLLWRKPQERVPVRIRAVVSVPEDSETEDDEVQATQFPIIEMSQPPSVKHRSMSLRNCPGYRLQALCHRLTRHLRQSWLAMHNYRTVLDLVGNREYEWSVIADGLVEQTEQIQHGILLFLAWRWQKRLQTVDDYHVFRYLCEGILNYQLDGTSPFCNMDRMIYSVMSSEPRWRMFCAILVSFSSSTEIRAIEWDRLQANRRNQL